MRTTFSKSIRERVASLDWPRITRELDARGFAVTGPMLRDTECAALVELYPNRESFRSRIVMERLGYGIGEYKYFANPLPAEIRELRIALYRKLVTIANCWSAALGDGSTFPASLSEYLKLCHDADQTRPTPLLLRYEAQGFNCLHQDLYGELAFPLQFTCVLSQRGRDFEGGELLFVEQRPRKQSRGSALVLERGEGVIFANRYRPVAGKRGAYRVNMRHGVSTMTSGVRYSLGIIFHDAR